MAQIKIGRGSPSDFSSLATKDQNEIYFINSNNPQDSNIYVGDKMMATMDLAELATGDIKGTIYYSGGSGNTVSKLVFNSSTDAGKFLSVNSSGVLSWVAALTSYVQSDWNQDTSTEPDYILNRPAVRAGTGTNAVVMGDIANNVASGEEAIAEGGSTKAIGYHSHTEGYGTIAYDSHSHAEGYGFNASSAAIIAPFKLTTMMLGTPFYTIDIPWDESFDRRVIYYNGIITRIRSGGLNPYDNTYWIQCEDEISTETITNAEVRWVPAASNFQSHTEGARTSATGNASHAEGNCTLAINQYEHAQGQFNKPHKANTTFGDAGNTLNSIGIGTSESDRKNAVEVMQNGDVYITGIGDYVGDNYSTAKTLQECIADTQGTGQNMVSVTCYELSELVTNSQLVPGQQYRITDYECTTTQEKTHSAGHQFDIIVVADSENILNENARATQHTESDQDYFYGYDLDSWELKYSLSGSQSRFRWCTSGLPTLRITYTEISGQTISTITKDLVEKTASYWKWGAPREGYVYTEPNPSVGSTVHINMDLSDTSTKRVSGLDTSHKGVIYYMKDEFGNECPYDFKNILFERPLTDGVLDDENGTMEQVYTFTAFNRTFSTIADASMSSAFPAVAHKCSGNIIKHALYDGSVFYQFILQLNNNVFLNIIDVEENQGYWCVANVIGSLSCNNTFGNHCSGNSLGNGCLNNSFGDNCYSNSFGNECNENSFGNDCLSNSFGDGCSNNSFGGGCYNNSFGGGCSLNTFGEECYENTFGNYCEGNIFTDYCTHNSFGNECQSNSLTEYSCISYTVTGNGFSENTIDGYIQSSTIGNGFFGNIISGSVDSLVAEDIVEYCEIVGGTGRTSLHGLTILGNTVSEIDNRIVIDAPHTSSTGNSSFIAALRMSNDGRSQQEKLVIWDSTVQADWNQTDTNAKDYIKNKPGISDAHPIKYSDLLDIRNNGELVPGQQYRITDYNCTTRQEFTTSAGHQFDIIVTADSKDKLNETARAIEHISVLQVYDIANEDTFIYKRYPQLDDNDAFCWVKVKNSAGCEIDDPTIEYGDVNINDRITTDSEYVCVGDIVGTENNFIVTDIGDPYFHNSKLESWELKYCIDNDTTRFHWAAEPNYILSADYDDYIEDPHGHYQPEPFNEFLDTLNDLAGQSDEYEYSGTLVLDGHTYYKWVDANGSGINVLTSERHPSVSNVIRSISDFGRIVAYIQNDELYDHSSAGADESYITRYDDSSDIIYIDHIRVLDGGHGVVYYMKDEWNNECPYDFKNIQFKRWAITADQDHPSLVVNSGDNYYGYYYGAKSLNGTNVLSSATYGNDFEWFYTFALKDLESGHWYDYTVVAHLGLKNNNDNEMACYDNHLEPATEEFSSGKGEMAKMLNNIVFFNCYTDLSDTSYADDYSYCSNNRFLGNCHSNTFGNSCGGNSFGNYCYRNTFGNDCSGNSFGNNFQSNSFGNGCYGNSFGKYFQSNSFGNSCFKNSFGNECYQNSFGNSCYRNTFGNHCYQNSFGNYCNSNSFGNDCLAIRFSSSSGTARNYYQYIIVESGNQHINLDCTGTLSGSSIFRNVKIAQGVNNTSTYKTIQDSRTNQTFQTVYQPENSEIISV